VQKAFDKDEPYFNAGVAVINFDKWRSQNVTGTIMRQPFHPPSAPFLSR
jgi:lipopolysaccharide biosynthesis glycosyltransferase